MATRGFENFTATDAARHALKHARKAIAGPGKPKAARSKYGAVKTTVDGIVFDSKREAARYGELKILERKGLIRRLVLQPSYPMDVFGVESRPIAVYRADFSYWTCVEGGVWVEVVEDVKGFKTAVYRLKKKHVEAQYGIQIREIR